MNLGVRPELQSSANLPILTRDRGDAPTKVRLCDPTRVRVGKSSVAVSS